MKKISFFSHCIRISTILETYKSDNSFFVWNGSHRSESFWGLITIIFWYFFFTQISWNSWIIWFDVVSFFFFISELQIQFKLEIWFFMVCVRWLYKCNNATLDHHSCAKNLIEKDFQLSGSFQFRIQQPCNYWRSPHRSTMHSFFWRFRKPKCKAAIVLQKMYAVFLPI